MLPETILDQSPAWLLYAGTVLALRPRRVVPPGTLRRAHMPEGEKARQRDHGFDLGLLAFMLAFTFGMSALASTREAAGTGRASAVLGLIDARSSCRAARSE